MSDQLYRSKENDPSCSDKEINNDINVKKKKTRFVAALYATRRLKVQTSPMVQDNADPCGFEAIFEEKRDVGRLRGGSKTLRFVEEEAVDGGGEFC